MRHPVAAAALAVALAAVPATAAAPGAPGVTRDVRVSGRAGDVATFRLDRTVRIGEGGTGVTVLVPYGTTWSGVAITRLDAPASSDGLDTYVSYRLHDRLLCPGELCEPSFQPYLATSRDGLGYALLRPGRYGVALLGPRGTPVSAALHLVGPRKGRTTLRPVRAASYEVTMFDPSVTGPDGHLVSRGFRRVDARGRQVVDSVAIGFALEQPAALQYAICSTAGGSRSLDGTGGVAPCADDDGEDLLLGPETQAVPQVPYGTTVAGVGWWITAGRARPDAGLGYEAQIGGAQGRMVALHFAVAFP